METTLKVFGMHCASCAMLIEDAISEIPGAQVLSVDHVGGTVRVNHDSEATLEAIRQAIQSEGFTL